MTDHCKNIKSQLEEMLGKGLSDKAKLVALLEACGICDREEVERLLECKSSTLRDARRALKIQRQKSVTCTYSDGNPAPEIRHGDGNPSKTTEIQRQKSVDSSCAHATKESFQDTLPEKVITLPLPPKQVESASVGEEDFGHGVFVNCKTIRHAAFTISLPAIELGTQAAHKSKDEIKNACIAHALQWAAEIENGKRPDAVLPQKIANFLCVSIVSEANRAAVQSVRISKAEKDQGFAPMFQNVEKPIRTTPESLAAAFEKVEAKRHATA